MFILTAIILLIINSSSKKNIIFLLVIASSIFLISYKYNYQVQNNFRNLYVKVSQIQDYTKSIFENMKFGSEIIIPNTYIKEIHNGILAFNSKKIFGGGLKSHKISCQKYSKYSCAPHPHNYHVEILISAGIVG